jgi:hypothetical protein
VLIARAAAEALPVGLFDELADGQLPPLLRTRAQPEKFPRIHAERTRHLDLTRSRQIFVAFVHASWAWA